MIVKRRIDSSTAIASFLFAAICMIACERADNKFHGDTSKSPNLDTIADLSAISTYDCYLTERIERVDVLSSTKVFENEHRFALKFFDECSTWTLTAGEQKEILLNSSTIDGHEFHHFFNVLPCSYVAEVLVNENCKARAKINSGGITTLIFSDTSIWLASPAVDSLFITSRIRP